MHQGFAGPVSEEAGPGHRTGRTLAPSGLAIVALSPSWRPFWGPISNNDVGDRLGGDDAPALVGVNLVRPRFAAGAPRWPLLAWPARGSARSLSEEGGAARAISGGSALAVTAPHPALPSAPVLVTFIAPIRAFSVPRTKSGARTCRCRAGRSGSDRVECARYCSTNVGGCLLATT
jgi:hypothetical protein